MEAMGVVIAIIGAIASYRFLQSRLRRRLQASARRAIRQFRVRLDRYKLVERHRVRDELLSDPTVRAAMQAHCAEHGLEPDGVEDQVRDYIQEIVPFFNVLSYYRIGYNISRLLIRLLYRVNVEFLDNDALDAIPRGDVVVYVMNHRSNADYVVVAYVLAGRVSISYAVGEWARVWPLEYVFKSFGAYFVRRKYREPLYHTVLERYVQLITRHGVTQGVFLEGGLTRDGRLRDPKLGLLDYVVRTTADPAFTADIWLVPVALNYDRVLEDRTLTRELMTTGERPGRWRQMVTVTRFFAFNLSRALRRSLKRYGRVGITFGTPQSVRAWSAQHPGAMARPAPERLPALEQLARSMMDSIAGIMPITPVPLTAAALLSFEASRIRESALLDRLRHWRDRLIEDGRQIERHLSAEDILDRAWIMLGMRRLLERDGDQVIISDEERPLLRFYANSVHHLTDTLPIS